MTSSDFQERLSRQLARIPLFHTARPDFLHALSAQAQLISLEKNQILFLHEDPASRFYLVDRGRIKLFRETRNGEQAVIDIVMNSHLFGETSLFENDLYPYSAEAAEPSCVFSLPLSVLKAEIETTPKTAMAMLSSMAHTRRQQDQELEHRTLQNAPQRLGCFLLRLLDQQTDGPGSLELPYDKTLIAARLGMQPETFSRALSKLKAETGLQVTRGRVELNSVQQLADYSCTACSSEFPCKDLCGKKF
ncbi:MAG: Crp/Fnr family transcriptional regulator [Rhodospirillales bacterium]|nr:Crp/Fnr family transcriptional regulator [Rhodospirillales bacterium]MCB9980576.1 Crp/Fnr family transcriptional regulator [Rhodospirillales bacterium]